MKNVFKSTILFALVASIMIISACSTTPTSVGQSPDWVLSPPRSTDTAEVFVVSANEPDGNIARAEEAATLNLISEINRVLGVEITSSSTAEARATAESYEANVLEIVTQSASGLIAGLRIVDKFVFENENGITVYILAEYNKVDLNREKAKRQALIAEIEGSISGPEAEGDSLARQGKYQAAFEQYLIAVEAARGADVRNAEVRLERNLQKALRVIGEIRLDVIGSPGELFVNQRNAEPFVIEAIDRSGRPLSEMVVRVSWREVRSNGRTRVRNEVVVTDNNGIAEFVLENPSMVGDQDLTVSLDIDEVLENLDSMPRDFEGLVEGITDTVAGIRTRYSFEVVSLARGIPTGVVVLDLDNGGNPTGSSETSNGILNALNDAGFQVSSLPISASQIQDLSDREILTLLQAQNLSVERVVFGTVQIVEVDERDGFIVKVSGDIRAMDLNSGEILFSDSGIKNSRASSSRRAISSAFTGLGEEMGEALARELP